MRKGRSSRRSRSVRPLGTTLPPRSVEALSTDIESTPRVVLGVPPSDVPTTPPEAFESELPSVSAKADSPRAIDVVIPRLPSFDPIAALAERSELPPPAPVEAPQQDAQIQEAAPAAPDAVQAKDETVRSSPTATDEVVETASKPEEPAVDTQRSLAPQVLSLSLAEPEPATAPSALLAEAAAEERTLDPDDISVPPIGDVAFHDEFFSEGDLSARLAGDTVDGESLTVIDKAARKSDPRVVQRRAKFARYVTWAVTGAAVVCLLAVGRTALSAAVSPSAQAQRSELATASKEAVQAVAPVEQPSTPAAVVVATPTPQPVASNDQPEPATPADEAKEAAEPTAVDGDAQEEKTKARIALEHRKLADAIEAGELSVKLDPSDGEAWLILGAAYQEKGNMVQARRAYASCVSEGKTGPRQECAKMLR